MLLHFDSSGVTLFIPFCMLLFINMDLLKFLLVLSLILFLLSLFLLLLFFLLFLFEDLLLLWGLLVLFVLLLSWICYLGVLSCDWRELWLGVNEGGVALLL